MNYLAIDTSGKGLNIALKANGKLFTDFDENCNLLHSVILMPKIEAIVEKSGIELKDIDVFCCAVGAGSFTGIRIGVSCIKAFAYALGKKVLPITSFDVLAYNSDKESVLSVIDAKHNHVYACGYKKGEVCLQPCYISYEEAAVLSKEFVLISSEKIQNLDTEIIKSCEGLIKAVEIKLDKATLNKELVPLYVRKSQAEEETLEN